MGHHHLFNELLRVTVGSLTTVNFTDFLAQQLLILNHFDVCSRLAILTHPEIICCPDTISSTLQAISVVNSVPEELRGSLQEFIGVTLTRNVQFFPISEPPVSLQVVNLCSRPRHFVVLRRLTPARYLLETIN